MNYDTKLLLYYQKLKNSIANLKFKTINNESIVGEGNITIQGFGNIDWANINNKPSVFTPSTHNHPISDIVDLSNTLNGKADSNHSHSLDNISDGVSYVRVTPAEKTNWNGKSDFSGSYIDLLDIPNEFNPSSHSHTISNITNLQATLDGKANSSHTHTKSNISDLETITTTPTASAIPKADASGKIANGWLNTGTGNGLDADTLDGQHASAFSSSIHNHNLADLSEKSYNSLTDKPATFPPSAHQSNHQSGGSDALSGNLDAIARVLLKKANVNIGSRRAINFIDGSNVTINVVDDSVNEKVDVTISAPSGGGVTYAQRTLTADETKVNDTSVQNWFASENRLLLDANSIYEFEGTFVSLNGTTSHGLNMQFDAITGASIRWTAIGAKVNETTQATALRFTMTNTFNTNRNVTTPSTVGGNVVWISGIIITGASSGYFSPKVAQTAASGSFTVKAGTYMKVRKVGAIGDINIGGWTT